MPLLASTAVLSLANILQVLEGITLVEEELTITFDSSAQDVISLLGEPTVVHRKKEDKMRIHSQEDTVKRTLPCTAPLAPGADPP